MLYRKDGGGSFSDATTPPLNHGNFDAGATWTDFDRDGLLVIDAPANGECKFAQQDCTMLTQPFPTGPGLPNLATDAWSLEAKVSFQFFTSRAPQADNMIGIGLFYIGSMVLSLFGVTIGYFTSSSPLAIGINLAIAGVAALNLVLDFDRIEQGVRAGAPKQLEWFAAFGLMVTLIWLYLELLRLLSRLQGRRD
jgi:hypothetical protein